MSALVVVLDRRGAPVAPTLVSSLLGVLDHRGPDGSDIAVRGEVGLGHQHFWTTPEEVDERQPIADGQGRLHLVMDGRVDNRDELLHALDLDGAEGARLSDAALVLRAFERWGTACFERLLGSFAVVVADHVNRRLVAARDHLGNRALYFHLTDGLLILASEEWAVLQHPAVPRAVDEGHVAAYFSLEVPACGSTFFSSVRELWPAHVLEVSRTGARLSRYWDAKPGARLRYRDQREYGEHFRELLERSVVARLRANGAPAAGMSGGLDSTSAAALAQRHLARRGSPDPLRVFSWVFSELPSCDERSYIEEVHRHLGTEAVYVAGDDAWPLSDLAVRAACPSRPDPNAYRSLKRRLYEAARDRGHRVLLSGAMGDELYDGATPYFTELVLDGRWSQVLHEARSIARAAGQPAVAKQLLRGLPWVARALYRRGLGRRRKPWLSDWAAARRPDLLSWPTSALRARRPDQHRALLGLAAAFDAAGEAAHSSRSGVEVRLPYRDRRLVELALALPAYQLYASGVYKVVARDAMQGLLPDRVRTRTRPTLLTPLFLRGVAEREGGLVRRVLAHPAAAGRRFVSPDWLERSRPGAVKTGVEELVIWLYVALELWYADHGSSPVLVPVDGVTLVRGCGGTG